MVDITGEAGMFAQVASGLLVNLGTPTPEQHAASDALPFLRRLADGTLPEEAFRFYLAQDALYLSEFARLLAEAARCAADADQQEFWAECARRTVAVELEMHASWVAAPPVTAAPATTAYLDHLRGLASDGDHPVLTAALLPCYWLYADLGARLRSGAFGPEALDPAHAYAEWLRTYDDPVFAADSGRAIELVTGAAATADPTTRARMRAAFERSAEHERAFFAATVLKA